MKGECAEAPLDGQPSPGKLYRVLLGFTAHSFFFFISTETGAAGDLQGVMMSVEVIKFFYCGQRWNRSKRRQRFWPTLMEAVSFGFILAVAARGLPWGSRRSTRTTRWGSRDAWNRKQNTAINRRRRPLIKRRSIKRRGRRGALRSGRPPVVLSTWIKEKNGRRRNWTRPTSWRPQIATGSD